MLYETALYTLILAALWPPRDRIKVNDQIFFLYLMLGGASRFAVKFVRINQRVPWGLSEAQLITIEMMVAGAARARACR
jgi:phosphatidylglycerol:prolipoprotein diacylglycerol transferase